MISLDEALREAELSIKNAQEVRSYHRKRSTKGEQQREDDLSMAIERVKAAMKPLRSEIGRFPRQPPTAKVQARQAQIRAASKALQRERRKLWKMLNHSGRNA